MANQHENLASLFTDTADAIREKTGESEAITADHFPERIRAIPTGGTEAAAVPFETAEWGPPASVTVEEGTEYDGASGYELVIPSEKHGRKSGNFAFQIFHLVEGVYKTNTWGALGTEVRYDAETGSVVLASADAYSGKILFVG